MHDDESVVFSIKKLLGFLLGAQLETFSKLHLEYSVKNKLLLTVTVCLLVESIHRFSLFLKKKTSEPQRIIEVDTNSLSFQSKLQTNELKMREKQ